MNKHRTEQEDFWAGDFGDAYIDRNQSINLLSSKISLFSKIFQRVENINSFLEFGANIGLNLRALELIFPNAELSALEINQKAVDELKKHKKIIVYDQSIFDYLPDYQRDVVFVMGVLIHLDPNMLQKAYEVIYNATSKYILLAEYYSPKPVELDYRGYQKKLFKRDFAGELMDYYKDLTLIDYGFVYHRDKNFPLDDITWFLLRK